MVFPYNDLRFESDVSDFSVIKDHARRLCDDYLNDKFTQEDLSFLANLLLFFTLVNEGWRFASITIEDAINFIVETSSAGPLSKFFINQILEEELI